MSNRNTKAIRHAVGDRVRIMMNKRTGRIETATIVDLGPSASGDTLYWARLDADENVTTAIDGMILGGAL